MIMFKLHTDFSCNVYILRVQLQAELEVTKRQIKQKDDEIASVHVCVGTRQRASLNRYQGECIAVLSPTLVEVAVLLCA